MPGEWSKNYCTEALKTIWNHPNDIYKYRCLLCIYQNIVNFLKHAFINKPINPVTDTTLFWFKNIYYIDPTKDVFNLIDEKVFIDTLLNIEYADIYSVWTLCIVRIYYHIISNTTFKSVNPIIWYHMKWWSCWYN